MGSKNIPIKLAGLSLFIGGSNNEFATGDITLPNFTNLSDTLSGAGILGEVDVPTPGHYSSMQLGISWRTIDKDSLLLVGTDIKSIEARGAFSEFNTSTSVIEHRAFKGVFRGMGKEFDLGSLVLNSATNTTTNVELTYAKIFIDGAEVFELDKLNSVCRINGVDVLLDINKILGRA